MMQISNSLQSRIDKVERVMHLLQYAEPAKLVIMITSLESDGEVKISKALGLLLQESFSSQ